MTYGHAAYRNMRQDTKHAVAHGMVSKRRDAMSKVANGITLQRNNERRISSTCKHSGKQNYAYKVYTPDKKIMTALLKRLGRACRRSPLHRRLYAHT
jgi:hypothetical protein